MAQLAINLSSAIILRQAKRGSTPDPVHLAVAAEIGGAETVSYAARLKLGIHVGGALDIPAIKRLKAHAKIDWFSVGHSAVARALLTGMAAVRDFQHLIARTPTAL